MKSHSGQLWVYFRACYLSFRSFSDFRFLFSRFLILDFHIEKWEFLGDFGTLWAMGCFVPCTAPCRSTSDLGIIRQVRQITELLCHYYFQYLVIGTKATLAEAHPKGTHTIQIIMVPKIVLTEMYDFSFNGSCVNERLGNARNIAKLQYLFLLTRVWLAERSTQCGLPPCFGFSFCHICIFCKCRILCTWLT